MAEQQDNDQEIKIPTSLEISRILVYLTYAWTFFGIFTLTLRTFLLATGANLGTQFSSFIVRVSERYLQPFYGIFPNQQINDSGNLDISAIFAIIIYLFFAWAVKMLIDYINLKVQNLIADERRKQLQKSARRFKPRNYGS